MENKFSENVKAMRQQLGLTQSELAEKLQTTQRKVSYWETGLTEPDISLLCKIADFFDVYLDELVGRSENKNKNETDS